MRYFAHPAPPGAGILLLLVVEATSPRTASRNSKLPHPRKPSPTVHSRHPTKSVGISTGA
jgi:hypothetical protein